MLFFGSKKKKYLDCPYLKHSLHFFHDEIRACCSNVKGPVFYAGYEGKEPVDFDYIYKKRQEYVKKINSPFNKESIPKECEGCYWVQEFLSDKKVKDFENKVKIMFIQNNMSCNAKCVYCVFANVEKGYKYQVVPILKTIVDNNLLDRNPQINLSGGEITITPDFEDLVNLLIQNIDSQIYISTSGIKYSQAIENAFVMNKCWQTISIDCGTRETYQRLKQVDCFDQIINNLKRYSEASNNAKNCNILKYILVDNINDNKEEVDAFFNVVRDIGIKNVMIDVNFEEYSFTNDKTVPEHQVKLIEYFYKTAADMGLNLIKNKQTDAILNK